MDEKTQKLDLIEELNLSETKEITKEINSLDDLKDIENEEVTVKRIIKKEKYLYCFNYYTFVCSINKFFIQIY